MTRFQLFCTLGLAVSGMALAVSPSASLAADLSRVRCENPAFVSYMSRRLPSLKSAANGTRLSQVISVQDITQSRTVSASRDKLICEISLRLSFRGTDQTSRGRFTTEQFANGKTSTKWQPLY